MGRVLLDREGVVLDQPAVLREEVLQPGNKLFAGVLGFDPSHDGFGGGDDALEDLDELGEVLVEV